MPTVARAGQCNKQALLNTPNSLMLKINIVTIQLQVNPCGPVVVIVGEYPECLSFDPDQFIVFIEKLFYPEEVKIRRGHMRSLVQENISEVMNPYLLTVSPYDTLAQAYELLIKNKIRRLPVVDNHKKLIGILTLKDVLEAKPSDIKHTLSVDDIYKSLSGLTVTTAMTNKPIAIYQTATIGNAAELMLEHKIGGLPVLDAEGNLVGMVTESDIFRLIVRRWRDENYLKTAIN